MRTNLTALKTAIHTALKAAGMMAIVFLASCSAEDDVAAPQPENLPVWAQRLMAADSRISLTEADAGVSQKHKKYRIEFKTVVDHDNASSQPFTLHAQLIVPITDSTGKSISDPTGLLMHTYVPGYALDEDNLTTYDNDRYDDNGNEIAKRYGGCYLSIEHRYFNKSRPERPWETFEEYCNARQAATDFHELMTTLKNVFNGWWVMSGVSKGGIATVIQHAYYPDDADVYVPYVAPFCDGQDDPRLYAYWTDLQRTWTPELHKQIQKIYHTYTGDENYIAALLESKQYTSREEVLWELADNVRSYDTSLHTYRSLKEITDTLRLNEQYLQDGNYTREQIEYMFSKTILSLQAYNTSQQAATRSISKETYEKAYQNNSDMAYLYQACKELGNYSFNDLYYYFSDKKNAEDAYNYAKAHSKLNYAEEQEWTKNYVYSPELRNFVMQKTKEATKPIIFIYGRDDMWTGAAMEDQYINSLGKKFILTGMAHSASFVRAPSATESKAITDFLDQCLQCGR